MKKYDKIIIGAGLYGLYAALHCGQRGEGVCVLERDKEAFSRATYANQARVHMGYHYPRSLSTALKSAGYFERFNEDFGFCVNKDFEQIYATSSRLGWTSSKEFSRFCNAAKIPCEEIPTSRYFRDGVCDGAFIAKEFTYDAQTLRDYFLKKIGALNNIDLVFNVQPVAIAEQGDLWIVEGSDGVARQTLAIINAAYSGINDIHSLAGVELFPIKYELCELILCDVSPNLKNIGITVMDGPFFSVMPFGMTGLHSLTSVTFTPHRTSRDQFATFPCQENSVAGCAPGNLSNCNDCAVKPDTAWPLMSALAKKYLRDEFGLSYKKSLYSMKPIMLASEVDDSRPTVVRVMKQKPLMVSVLSGKINTVYDLDPYLANISGGGVF